MKKLLEYIPFHLTACLSVGIFLAYSFQLSNFIYGTFILLECFLLLGYLFYKSRMVFTLFTGVLFIMMGVFIVSLQDERNKELYFEQHLIKGDNVVLKIQSQLKSGNYHTKYIAKVLQINHHKTLGTILLNIRKEGVIQPLLVDDELLLQANFSEIKPALNPHQFHYKKYLERAGIYKQVFTDFNDFKLLKNKTSTWRGMVFKIQNKAKSALFKHHFSKDEHAVINALLLGQRQALSKELLANYAAAGAIHILAVSGLHVGIILLLLSVLLKPIEQFKNGTFLKTFLLIVLLWMFAFIAGLSASVVRAVVMFTAIAIGNSLQRKVPTEHSLIIAMFFCLIVQPMFLFDVGFQLSFIAVFGIIWIQPHLLKLWKPTHSFYQYFWQLCTVSTAAQIAVLPLSLYYFHQFPGLFMVTNFVIIPCLGTLLICGIILIFLAVLNCLPSIIAEIYGFSISTMNRFVSFIANQEQFLLKEIAISLWEMFFAYLIMILLFQFLLQKSSFKFLRLLICIACFQAVFVVEKYRQNNTSEFIVFHQNKQSIIGERIGLKLKVYSSMNVKKNSSHHSITSYVMAEKLTPLFIDQFPAVFQLQTSTIVVVDSIGIYKLQQLNNPIVVLRSSPKINLNRLIENLQPQQIIADGSNYKSYLKNWQQICFKKGIPFHQTGVEGAFVISESD